MGDPVTDEQPPAQPDIDEAPGWYVTDPDGNVVDSGPMTVAQSVFLAVAGDTEGEQK
jgi:hypothetical protein